MVFVFAADELGRAEGRETCRRINGSSGPDENKIPKFCRQVLSRETLALDRGGGRGLAGAMAYHWENKSINWPMSIYITVVHVAALVGLFAISGCMRETWLLAFVLYVFT